ncbi:MAG: ribbon-helix-helix domain-containing protein [Actinomycetota bacterium]
MTMLSFRVEESEVRAVQEWAERLGLARSQVLRDALHKYLARLASEVDAKVWEQVPLDSAERSLGDVADWGPSEDWADWADAAR